MNGEKDRIKLNSGTRRDSLGISMMDDERQLLQMKESRENVLLACLSRRAS